MRPLYAVLMTTSLSARSCGGWAPASHQTTSSLIVSSLAKARSKPSGVANVAYTSSSGTPSAIRANSRFTCGVRRIARRPGNFSRSKKSAMVVGFSPGKFTSLYAYTVDQYRLGTPHSVWVSATKSSAAGVPSDPGGRSSMSIGSSSPSSQPRTASAISRSTTSQWMVPISTCARIWASPPL